MDGIQIHRYICEAVRTKFHEVEVEQWETEPVQ